MKQITDYQRRFKEFGQAVHSSSLISCVNLDGIITFVNQNFCDLSGYCSDELIGSNHQIVSSQFHPKDFWAGMWTTITHGHAWRGEVKNRARGGEYFWLDTFIYPVCRNGKVVEYLSIRNNITDKKEQECEIVKQNELLSKIAWIQSHGLRRPVSSILGLIQLFEDQNNNEKDSQTLLAHLKWASNELDFQIKEIVRLTEEVKVAVSTQITTKTPQ